MSRSRRMPPVERRHPALGMAVCGLLAACTDGPGLPAARGAGSGSVAAAAGGEPAAGRAGAGGRGGAAAARPGGTPRHRLVGGVRRSEARCPDPGRARGEQGPADRGAAGRAVQRPVAGGAGRGRAAGRRPGTAHPRRGQPEPLHPAGRRRLPGRQRLRDRRRCHLGDRLLGPGAPCQRIGACRPDGDGGGQAGAGPEPGGQRRLHVRDARSASTASSSCIGSPPPAATNRCSFSARSSRAAASASSRT